MSMVVSNVLHRNVVRVTWSALRGGALWPGWQDALDSAISGQIWAALLERGKQAGLSFGCGSAYDSEGDLREAACHVVGMKLLSYPGSSARDIGEIAALVGIESEARHGPNSFALGRELRWRLSGAKWRYAPDAVAAMDVTQIEARSEEAGTAHWLPIHPPRPGVL